MWSLPVTLLDQLGNAIAKRVDLYPVPIYVYHSFASNFLKQSKTPFIC